MAYEALAWPSPPATTNNTDPGQAYHMGARFHVLAGANCLGVRWRVPDSVPLPPGGTHYFTLWRVSDEALLASKTFTAVPGGDQDVLFDAAVALTAAPEEYVVAVYTLTYVFRGAATPFLVESPSLNVRHDRSPLIPWNAGTALYPGGNFSAWYYVSPLIEVAGPAGVVLDVRPAGTAPAGAAVQLRRGDLLVPRPTAALPGAGVVTFTDRLSTSAPTRPVITVSRPARLTTVSGPAAITTVTRDPTLII